MSTQPMSPPALAIQTGFPDGPGSPLQQEQPSTAGARFSWGNYGNLSLEAIVCLPLQQLSLAEVAGLAAGSVLRSAYHLTDELFLRIGGVEVANVTLEPAGLTRGVRVTNFDVRKPAYAPRSAACDALESLGSALVAPHLRNCVVALSLGFASRSILLQDALLLAHGQLLQMETLLHDPVSLLLGNRIIAYGTPVLQTDCYSILISRMVPSPTSCAAS